LKNVRSLLIVAAIAALAAGCSNPSSSSASHAPKSGASKTIGVSIQNREAQFYQDMETGMKSEAAKYGYNVDVVDANHPATAHLGPTWSWHDEVYLFSNLRPDARVLLALAGGQLDMTVPGARVPDCGFPLAWCRAEGTARSFYTALGHFPGAWETPAYLRHLAGGLTWLRESS